MVEREDALVRGVLIGVAWFRWLAWIWMAVVVVLSRPELTHPLANGSVAYVLAAAALGVTVLATVVLRRDPHQLVSLPAVALELAVGFALGVGDQLAYDIVDHPQSLASTWPLAGILTAGVAYGGRGGLIAGVVVGLGHLVGDQFDPAFSWTVRLDWVPAISTVVLYALAGGMAGFVMVRLREAERRVTLAQAREEVARTLHDGVLQTLALVQRRSAEPDMVHLARDQERELREFLFGANSSVGGGGEVGTRLRAIASRHEARYGGTTQVIVAPDVPSVSAEIADALVGAVSEALTNAAKHGEARRVVVFAEPAAGDELFCSVKDDGDGFDMTTTPEGIGLSRSVRGRIGDVGGRVEVDGRPGHGTEIRCWVPVA